MRKSEWKAYATAAKALIEKAQEEQPYSKDRWPEVQLEAARKALTKMEKPRARK